MKTKSHNLIWFSSFLVAFLLGLPVATKAQFRISPVLNIGDKLICHVGGKVYERTPDKSLIFHTSYAPTYSETQGIFEKVSEYTELRSNVYTVPVTDEDVNVEICPSDVDPEQGVARDYIVYNPTWLKSVYDDTNNLWALYGIVAHEIGHYANAHDRKSVGSKPNLELEADEYAGGVLAKMGACLTDAQAAFDAQVMKVNVPSHTHPPIAQRLAAVWKGWKKFGQCSWEAIPMKGVVSGRDYPGSFGYVYQGSGLTLSEPDDNNISRHEHSKLVFLEDGRPLTPHSLHRDIQGIGKGRYSHWFDERKTYLWFSASDNSDPRTNGKEYVVTVSK